MDIWQRARFISIEQHILNLPVDFERGGELRLTPHLLLAILESIFLHHAADMAICVFNGFLLPRARLAAIADVLAADGFANGSGFYAFRANHYWSRVFSHLQAFRGLAVSVEPPLPERPELSLPPADRSAHKHYCAIRIKSELAFSSLLLREMLPASGAEGGELDNHTSEDSRISVALLIPTANFHCDATAKGPLATFLLPSLVATLTGEECKKYRVTLYVGYDRGDPLFDHHRDTTLAHLHSLIPHDWPNNTATFRLVRLAKCRWLTYIWNRLFVEAHADGADYFLQVNDDVRFLTPGWLNDAVSLLRHDMRDVGVVGLHDSLWRCRLFTQALVSRRHHAIFHGSFFPVRIRDWFSDNWITFVYWQPPSDDNDTIDGQSPLMRCATSARIQNGNVKTRYEACDGDVWQALVVEGQQVLQTYLNAHKLA